jgi:hypothetical protein
MSQDNHPTAAPLAGSDKLREQLAARVRYLERELTDLRLDVWGQYALDMGDGWMSDGALSTLESIADDLMESGVFEMHPERRWYRVRLSPTPERSGPTADAAEPFLGHAHQSELERAHSDRTCHHIGAHHALAVRMLDYPQCPVDCKNKPQEAT